MPVLKVKGGYHVANTVTKKPLTKKTAEAQLRAIEVSKHSKGK